MLSPFRSLPWERLLRGEALAALGRYDEALGWYEGLAEVSVHDLPYLVPALMGSARVREAMGEVDGALRDYDRVLGLLSDAEPAFQPQRNDAARRKADLIAAATDSPTGS